LNPNLLGFLLSQREMISPHFDFNRVAQGGETDEFDRGPDEEAHFEQTSAVFGRNLDGGNGGSSAHPQGSERLSFRRHGLTRGSPGSDRLYQDGFRKLRADTEPSITNLANQVGLPAHQSNLLLFAKAKFAQTMQDFGWSGDLFDPNGAARDDAAERAKKRLTGAPVFA